MSKRQLLNIQAFCELAVKPTGSLELESVEIFTPQKLENSKSGLFFSSGNPIIITLLHGDLGHSLWGKLSRWPVINKFIAISTAA